MIDDDGIDNDDDDVVIDDDGIDNDDDDMMTMMMMIC